MHTDTATIWQPSKALRDAIGREGGRDLAILWPDTLPAPGMAGWLEDEYEPASHREALAAYAILEPARFGWKILSVSRCLLTRPRHTGIRRRGWTGPHLVAHVADDRSIGSALNWQRDARERPLKWLP